MKLVDLILISLAAAFVIIGISDMIMRGVAYGYWAIMLSIALFFLYGYRKKNKA